MRANALNDRNFRLDRTVFVLGVFRLQRHLRFRIGHLTVAFLDALEHFLGAIDDPHRLATPFDDLHLARRKFGNIRLNRRAGRFRPL